MMNKILAAIYVLSTLTAIALGRQAEAGKAVLEGAAAAITFTLSITGAMCLWSGISELMQRTGAASKLALLLRPLLKRLYPESSRDMQLLEALSENLSANMLGLGNGATPSGLKAARAMAEKKLTNELCMLVLLNSASVQIIPGTMAALRQSAGAAAAFDIMPAVWFSSLVSVLAGLLASRLLRRFGPWGD